MTLFTASRKSFSVATFLRARIANIPASVQTDLISAPAKIKLSILYYFFNIQDVSREGI